MRTNTFGTLKWNINALAASMHISASEALEFFQDGRRLAFLLEYRIANVFGGKRGDSQLTEIPNPPELQKFWRVEEEFISAIRGQEQITRTPFSVGVHYMEFTEAVTRSAQTGQAIALPL